jgi:hypothetical protein
MAQARARVKDASYLYSGPDLSHYGTIHLVTASTPRATGFSGAVQLTEPPGLQLQERDTDLAQR